jgi:ABC-2 type transport system permease protein
MSESVIHDIGYQRYEGPRLGRAYAVRSLYGQSLRSAFGLGRGAKSKIFPWAVAGIVFLVATVLTAIRSQGVSDLPVVYWNFAAAVWLLLALFCAVVAPELVSRDQRAHVLPLYFARPLTRTDYALAKLGALITAIWLLLAGPETLMLLGGVFTVDGLPAVRAEIGHWLQGLVVAVVFAVVFGALALLVASLAGRRGVAGAMVAASFLVLEPLYGIIVGLSARNGIDSVRATMQWAGLISPHTLAAGVAQWWFDPDRGVGRYGPLYGLVAVLLVAACAALLLLRYRKVAR